MTNKNESKYSMDIYVGFYYTTEQEKENTFCTTQTTKILFIQSG